MFFTVQSGGLFDAFLVDF